MAVLDRRGLIRGFCLDMHVLDTNQTMPRLGLIVAKRLAKHAVTRNLIKRQIREVFRRHASSLPAVDIVFRMSKGLESLGIESSAWRLAVRGEVESLLCRIESGELPSKRPREARRELAK